MDVYKILGVGRLATDEEIKQAYKKLSREYHPDHGGDPAKMAELNSAYALVSTPEARKKYNMSNSFAAEFNMFSSIFGRPTVAENFGKKPTNLRAVDGTDINLTVSIPVSVFLTGFNNMPLQYTRETECLECSGTGATKFVACPMCGNTGYVAGKGKRRAKCKKCNGKGIKITEKCQCCDSGVNRKNVTIPVNYRRFTTELQIKGRGNTGLFGGANGNLNVTFVPVPEPEFNLDIVDGTAIVRNVVVYPEDLVLGRTVDVRVAGKKMLVNVPGPGQPLYVDTKFDHAYPLRIEFVISPEVSGDDTDVYLRLKKLHEKV